MSQLDLLQRRINDQIPISRTLGVRLEFWDGQTLIVSAPLLPNRNHQGTGFGGSVYSVAVTGAWGLTELVLSDLGLDGVVVIQKGSIDYLLPVDTDFYVICRLPGGEVSDRFRKSLARYGKGRLDLVAEVHCGHPHRRPASDAVAVLEARLVVQDARSKLFG
ncbi:MULTISPECIES: YiiD C-terminal domain-containing protein [Marinobacter]|uniref:YiiD C-terminal domain-containing protein n=1 Tax=Marinobacter suaedae TaxID=3057675 RepID=A0ABT8W1B7_9GAMM|nr:MULTISPECIES: YiiD C-terminal domain-containing protein [unclassified Marinobacter]MBZ2169996.1 thioesterase domain-containing protein [Marinobacter sp. F4216]MDO3721976.1 YiiD C-terminal domain-containing protein [Marinobacter sp. chi1]